MLIKPLYDRILVERLEESEGAVKGRIILPDSAKEKPMEGRVVAVGSGAVNEKGERQPLDLKVGDKILFAKWGGTEVKWQDKEYLIMKESDVLARIG